MRISFSSYERRYYFYIHIYDGVFIIDFSFKEAGIATLIFVTPYFFINWLGYKYGKGSKYDKEKRLKEKLTYKIINDRYREKREKKISVFINYKSPILLLGFYDEMMFYRKINMFNFYKMLF
ncbi:hypothetical protein [Canicola haemoglobinophilus]|uniref:hypothetical protein n=1 Tax=Canicola haemoglobinophilus TaxID=733 RepID=UPI00117B77FF|nr:hypothetical protein [Canicola haemoglobinophilus]